MRRYLLLAILILGTVLSPMQAKAAEIVNAEKMPYALNSAFIDELWRVVVSAVNDEAVALRVPPDAKAPKLIYEPIQPEGRPEMYAEIEYAYNKSTLEVVLSRPRVIYLYPRPFAISPALAYGAIAQEFLHEAMLHQEIIPEFQHCLMIGRGTLAVAMKFIDLRLGTGKLAQKTLHNVTATQCTDDMLKSSK